MNRKTQPRYVIVPHRPDRRPLLWAALGLGVVVMLWLLARLVRRVDT